MYKRIFAIVFVIAALGLTQRVWSQEEKPSVVKKGPYVSFKTVYINRQLDFAKSILIEGELGGKGKLTLDGNTCTISRFGDKVICTKVAYPAIDIKMTRLNFQDGQGRRIYQIDGDIKPKDARFYFVVPRRKSEPHRLVVDHGKDIRSVFTLEPVTTKKPMKQDDKKGNNKP